MTWLIAAACGIAALFLIVRIRGKMLRKALAKERAEAGLPEPTDRTEVVPEGAAKVAYKCGHEGPKRFTVHLYGDTLEPSEQALSERKTCPQCALDEMVPLTARCALCGLPILPGQPVALYAGPSAAFTKEWTTEVEGQAMGCLRWDCCPSGGFFAGHWTGKEFRSAFGGGSAAAAAFASGGMVVVDDVDDPSSISVTPLNEATDESEKEE